jgi:hypothetical protein
MWKRCVLDEGRNHETTEMRSLQHENSVRVRSHTNNQAKTIHENDEYVSLKFERKKNTTHSPPLKQRVQAEHIDLSLHTKGILKECLSYLSLQRKKVSSRTKNVWEASSCRKPTQPAKTCHRKRTRSAQAIA